MKFEWDPKKAQSNIRKHKVTFKKAKQTDQDELRAEYKRTDFPGGLVRGKYAKRVRESLNIIVLKPEVAEAFPNEEAVNSALLSLIELARKTAHLTKHSTGRAKTPIGMP